MLSTEQLLEKWSPVLDHDKLPQIRDAHRRSVTAQLLENTQNELRQAGALGESSSLLSEAAPTNATGAGISNYDPILISLLRRAAPNLIAYDLAGVQPMTGPTGLIFAMRSRYEGQTGPEAFYNEANTAFSGAKGGTHTVANTTNFTSLLYGTGMTTANAEALGSTANNLFAEMAFSIEKVTVTAKSRALKAEYSMELAQDLKAIHGLDAESELANILTTEMIAEINRELIRTINSVGVVGAQTTSTPGTFDLDVDANGRWSVEKFKGLMFQLEREANAIAKTTRRGKGNILLCSSDVASALNMAGVLEYNPQLAVSLNVDDTGSTYAGNIGKIKVYIDPYAAANYATMGYKGSNAFDAGLFYCPYVPMQMVRAVNSGVGQAEFQPKIGFKTRYGMVTNPYSKGATASDGSIEANVNVYYRKFLVNNIL
jgi:hypothetical protein